MRLLPYGDGAVLAELDSLEQVHLLQRAVRLAGLGVDAVAGWRTLLVTTDGDLSSLRDALTRLSTVPASGDEPVLHEVPVTYDGPDLDQVAASCGLSVPEVVDLHLGADYTVAFLGFTRGFPYLAGLPAPLHLPRRDTPRTAVPAGSVAIATDQCGIYPASSPGGWHLLGRTPWSAFDPDRSPPTRLAPGDHVRFVPA